MILQGKCSEFGGPNDTGMANDTGLAFYEPHEADMRPDLFTSGGANTPTWKRLRTESKYIALNIPMGATRRWAQRSKWLVTNLKTNKKVSCYLVDRGPGAPGRVVDCSPGVLKAIDAKTDDILEVEELIWQ